MMANKAIILAFAQCLLTIVAGAEVTLNLAFFTDSTCHTSSSITPNATLGLDICAATLGALSIYVPTTACSGNNVRLLGYPDTGCKSTNGFFVNDGNCQEWENGAFGSILLTCEPADSSELISIISSTTYTVGPIAADNTGGVAAPTSSDFNPTSSAFLPTGTASGGTSTNTGSSGAGNSASSSSSSSSGWDALSIGAKVGIIVGAIVAVAIIGFLIWFIIYKERRHRRERMVAYQPANSGYGSNYGGTPYNNNGYISPSHQQDMSVYQPSNFVPPSTQRLNSPPPPQQHPNGTPYEPSRYPLSEVDWNQENNRSRYTGSELGASDIASWRDGTHTITAPTQH